MLAAIASTSAEEKDAMKREIMEAQLKRGLQEARSHMCVAGVAWGSSVGQVCSGHEGGDRRGTCRYAKSCLKLGIRSAWRQY